MRKRDRERCARGDHFQDLRLSAQRVLGAALVAPRERGDVALDRVAELEQEAAQTAFECARLAVEYAERAERRAVRIGDRRPHIGNTTVLAFGRETQRGIAAGVGDHDMPAEIERDLAIESTAPASLAGNVGVSRRPACGQHFEAGRAGHADERRGYVGDFGEDVRHLLPARVDGGRHIEGGEGACRGRVDGGSGRARGLVVGHGRCRPGDVHRDHRTLCHGPVDPAPAGVSALQCSKAAIAQTGSPDSENG